MNIEYNIKKTNKYLFYLVLAISFLFLLNASQVNSDILVNSTFNFTCDGSNASYYNITIYADYDFDSYISSGPIIFCTNGTIPIGYTNISNNFDCNDYNNSQYINQTGYADFDLDNYTLGPQIMFCTNGSLPFGYVNFTNISKIEDCNDTNSLINPGLKEIFYNNIDDDCNASTKDSFVFNITTLKDSYNINESVSFTIYSENSSNVNVTLIVPNNYYNYQVRFVNQSYPITDYLTSTRKAGEYIISASETFKNITIYLNKSINITNSINLALDGNLEVDQNASIILRAKASGGYGQNYNYTYYMGDGNTKIGQNISHFYGSSGDYQVTISVTDSEKNQKNFTYTVTVYKLYGLKIIALDKSTGGIISGATINVKDQILTTGSDGITTFIGRRGKYDFNAYKLGYDFYELSNYDFKENSTLLLKMSQMDLISPKITLYNKSLTIYDGVTQNLAFSVSDTSKVECSLYQELGQNWWSLYTTLKNITDSNTKNFEITNLNVSSQKYKIECKDDSGNNAVSEEGLLTKSDKLDQTIQNTGDSTKLSLNEEETISSLLNSVIELKSGFEKAGNKEKEIITILGLDKTLKDAERFSSNLERDLDAIKIARCPGLNCNLSESEKQKKSIDLINKAKESVDSIPVSLKVSSSEEFVKYPTKLDIESTIKSYFIIKGKILTTSQLKNLIEKTSLLQSKLTVSTKIYSVDLEYANGEKNQLTIVKKSLDLYDKENALSGKSYALVEDIQFGDLSGSKIDFISKSEKIKNDNLYEIPTTEKSIVYTINKKIDTSKLKLSNTMILLTSPPQTSMFTGFAISASLNPKDNWPYLLMGFVLFAIIIRFMMWFGLFSYIKKKMFSKEKEYHEMMMLINDAKDYLDAKDIGKSVLVYKEIRLKYEQVAQITKERVYTHIFELCQKLDEEYLKNLIEIGKDETKSKQLNIEKFIDVVQNIYSKLKDASKSLVENDLIKLKQKFAKN